MVHINYHLIFYMLLLEHKRSITMEFDDILSSKEYQMTRNQARTIQFISSYKKMIPISTLHALSLSNWILLWDLPFPLPTRTSFSLPDMWCCQCPEPQQFFTQVLMEQRTAIPATLQTLIQGIVHVFSFCVMATFLLSFISTSSSFVKRPPRTNHKTGDGTSRCYVSVKHFIEQLSCLATLALQISLLQLAACEDGSSEEA